MGTWGYLDGTRSYIQNNQQAMLLHPVCSQPLDLTSPKVICTVLDSPCLADLTLNNTQTKEQGMGTQEELAYEWG